MNDIVSRLEEREKSNHPITVALIGAGQMGVEIIAQVEQMAGIEINVVVDLTIEKALLGYGCLANKYKILRTNDLNQAEKALNTGKKIATKNYLIATRCNQIDVVVDATGSVEMGAITSFDAINNKKHIVMMSVECDVTVGLILRKLAENAGVIYTLAAGDEPVAIIELYRFATALGFKIITAGKGKNNLLDIYATPKSLEDKAKARNMNPRMLCEFEDGSKTAIEMAAVSNATGLVPDIRGMHGANSTVAQLKKIFIPKKDGGIIHKIGVVDYAIGVSPGVFLIFKTDNDIIKNGLAQRGMGEGPYYLLFRPYHLCSVEVPLTIAQIIFYNESSGHPNNNFTSECIAIAKRDLKTGETLDKIGETCYRGSIELADIAKKDKLLPLGLAKGMLLKKDVRKDEVITYDMVDRKEKEDNILYNLRKLQDKLL